MPYIPFGISVIKCDESFTNHISSLIDYFSTTPSPRLFDVVYVTCGNVVRALVHFLLVDGFGVRVGSLVDLFDQYSVIVRRVVFRGSYRFKLCSKSNSGLVVFAPDLVFGVWLLLSLLLDRSDLCLVRLH